MPKNNSVIIAFEGLDCSFKETNYNRFLAHLHNFRTTCDNELGDDIYNYVSIYNESFPRYGHNGCCFVEGWLDDTFDRDMLKANPEIIDSFYALDRFWYWYARNGNGTRMIDLINNTDKFRYFVFDRYNISNAIYNPVYPGVDIRDFNFDYKNFKIPKPDIVVWMRMHSFDKLCELIASKKEKDANEFDIEFIRKAWERSEEIIKSDVFDILGIKLIIIECLDENGNARSKSELDWNVWSAVTSCIEY